MLILLTKKLKYLFCVNIINMDKTEEILRKNLIEFFELADLAFEREKYNAAVTLYYKSLVEICDIFLLKSINKIGANHTERFELLRNCNPELFNLARKLFRFYRDSYSKNVSKAIAESVKENVENAKRFIKN